ncbi:chromosome segregation protein SMC [uncultured Microscilla sp.]|uniref:chromosome segregation protein SMC n=1 Tax=uncultured Microscilla sp. TaxID=432653 RepID=UPI00260ED5BF|nr:chromosome segregation protein SMC [uncultured Microscilla sp.]
MLLKKLEIKGFKSFGDKVHIDFTTGVTGIVGPNGCGKSNVVDAIRWVLGEQRTKNLRSDKMSNVIFNGTRARGQGRTAEVSLTFDNNKHILPPEYSQVTITRRYHRSGDSEYMINYVPCRLKDIQDLFLDTGIGSDSYAIIELKKVDEILNDKENARRSLFEKAAGVSKYKNRKKQALNRLDGVDKDLHRVNDLLAEIEKNLNSLERQAKQAERFFRLKEQYKKASISYASTRIKRERDAFLLLNDKLETETAKKDEIQRALATKEHTLEQKKQEVLQYEQHYSAKQKKLNNHLGQLRHLENEKKLKDERLSFSTEKTTTLKDQIAQDTENKDTVYQSLLQLEAQRGSAEKMWQELEMELQNYKEGLDEQKEKTAEVQQLATNKEAFFKQKEQEAFQLNKDYEIKQSQLSSAKQALEKVANADSQQNEELQRYELELTQIEKDLAEVKLRLADWQQKEEQRRAEVSTLEENVEGIRVKLSAKNRALDAKQNEYKLTKSLIDNMEGFPEALKFLKKNSAQWTNNTPYLLSDIITTRDPQYLVAIENYLEPFLNYYIVQNAAEAYEAIRLLSESEKGKANFFILDHLLPQATKATQPTDLTNAVCALDIAEFDTRFRPLFEHLLANVWIVENEVLLPLTDQPLPAVLNDVTLNVNVVSLNGEFVRRHPAAAGGSVGAFEGKRIGRVKNLEKLSLEIASLQQEVEDIDAQLSFQQNDLQQRKQDQTFRNAIKESQKEASHSEGIVISLRTKREQLTNLQEKNRQAQEEITEKVALLQEEIGELLPQTNHQKTVLEDLAYEVENLKEQLLAENEGLQLKSSRYNQQNIAFHQQQNKLATIDQEIGYKQQTLTTLENRLVKYRQELVQVEVEAGQLLDSQESQDALIEELQEKTAPYSEEVKAAEKEYYDIRKLVNDLDKELRELQRRKESLSVILNELQNKIHETKINLTSISERLSAEFQVDIDQLMLATDEDEPQEDKEGEQLSEVELQAEVETIKRKLEKIGTINPMAMDQYQESKERRDFIVEQKEDLLKSKESLLQTIAETEEYAKNAFMEAFDKIRSNFLTVFRSLFSEEDTADLILTDPENPLESKIDIIAKPKGKRPLTINQLSGGEKTLTATSLLFALYLLKPAPFCIFDEVDAPLDDANTEKFNQIIKTFSKDSQFIIVTHNKRTMASTDLMYGVTMREQGVSTVVPVDLRGLD